MTFVSTLYSNLHGVMIFDPSFSSVFDQSYSIPSGPPSETATLCLEPFHALTTRCYPWVNFRNTGTPGCVDCLYIHVCVAREKGCSSNVLGWRDYIDLRI